MEIISAPRRRSRSSSQRPRRNCHFFCGTKEKEGGQSFSPSTLLYSALLQIATYGTIGSLRRPGGGEQCASGACGQRRKKGTKFCSFPRSLRPSFSTGESPLCFASLKGNPNHRPRWPFVRPLLLSPLISISHDASSHRRVGGSGAGITEQITQHAVSVVAAGVAVRARVGLCSSLALLTI